MIRLDHKAYEDLDVTAVLMDGWKPAGWCELEKDTDTYTDDSWQGCDFRYLSQAGLNDEIACNLVITSRKSKALTTNYESRVKIELVRDGEPNEFVGGIIYHNNAIGA